ncbi:MAG: endonuclease/exonuclease/phosphatase family protein [Flavobacteriaceae bacterium]|nr:endonuclease/exonuclease/phosphatase family protein [Flavobacteriaceae bacterium]
MGLFGKLIYGVNVIVALLLVISFVLPYLSPSRFPILSLLSLTVSPLILLNILFAVYWLIRLKRRFLLSTIILVIAYFHFNPFLEFSSEGVEGEYDHSLKVLSYNVRLFNAYEKDPSEEFLILFSDIIEKHDPDVICIQEFFKKRTISFANYPYRYVHYKGENNKLGHAIFSKYPIVKKGAFDFENSFNNTLYADIVKGKDTVRVYNLHLQSLGVLPSVDYLQEGNKERMLKRLSRGFKRQEEQTLTILNHKASSPYPVIMTGDFNNTPFSYIYRKFEEEMQDGFLQRGSGLGTTFRFDSYPMRIDYIFADPKFEFVKFNTISETFSDHYPVTATLAW